MELEEHIRVITLKDLWDVFRHRFLLMVLAAIIVMGGMFAFNKITFTPQYDSTATLYILRQSNDGSDPDSYYDFSLALNLVNDCDHLLKSHAVLDAVIQELNLDMDYEDLYGRVSVANPEETRVLEVTVAADSPEMAKKIVDKVCEKGTVKIDEAMGIKQVNLYEYGVLDPEPSNRTGLLMYLLMGMVAAVFVYSYYLVRFLLDDRIRTDEDIERHLGLSILGEIPNANAKKHGKYGYGGYGYGKGYGYGYGQGQDKGKASKGKKGVFGRKGK